MLAGLGGWSMGAMMQALMAVSPQKQAITVDADQIPWPSARKGCREGQSMGLAFGPTQGELLPGIGFT
jgi:hypothetical protein